MNKALECAREIVSELTNLIEEARGDNVTNKATDITTDIIQQAITEAKREGFMAGVEAAADYMQQRGEKAGVGNDRKSFCKAWSLAIRALKPTER